MPAPAEAKSFHTVWVQHGNDRPVSARYALSGDNLICFGDEGLASLPDGSRVTATLHKIAHGAPVATFGATLRDVPADDVDVEALIELLAHVPVGRTSDEVKWGIEHHRRTRRIGALVP